MKQGDTVIIKKIAAAPNAAVDTAQSSEYIPGSDNNDKSPPVEYEVEGRLRKDVKIGESVQLFRWRRNNVITNGEFVTSPVMRITADGFETLNSVYKITKVYGDNQNQEASQSNN